MDANEPPIRLEDLVTDEDRHELREIAIRVAAECAALQHTRLPADSRDVE